MKVPDKVINNYLEDTTSKFSEYVFKNILNNSYDEKLVEDSTLEFYTKKNGGIKPNIKWVDNPLVIRDMYIGESVNLYSSYFNVNWVYFYSSFIDYLIENNIDTKTEYFDLDEELYLDSKLVFNILSNTFGVCEIPGDDLKYKEIVLIKKPNLVLTQDHKLHSIKGPAFSYDDNRLRFYFIEGLKFDEETWVRIMKTSLSNPSSMVNDILKESEILELKNYITKIETTIGVQEELSIKNILLIENIEEKSKIIKYIGYNMVTDVANLITQQSITTHKGDIVNYQLFEINLGLEIDNIPSRFVKVVCWSTGKEYVLQVDPRDKQCETPIGAIAWTCVKPDGSNCTEEEYLQLEFQT
jgi:hypothetical protein